MSRKEHLKNIYIDTLDYADEISKLYQISLSPSIKLKMKNEDIIQNFTKEFTSTYIQVLNQDVIKTCIELHNQISQNPNQNILVLNLASKKTYGGGVKNGAMAQEEELFRKTTYGKHKGAELYPLNLGEFVLTPNVYVIKDEKYNKLCGEKIFPVDMLAISVICNPKLIAKKFSESDYKITFEKIETIFKYALHNKNKNLILGAIGCGVFSNPPMEIISMYNICITKYNGYFENIIFAVKSIRDNNFKLFNEHIIRF